MGFTTLIDIIGAMVIGGILLITLFRIQDSAISSFFFYNSDLILQSDLVSIVSVVERDFKRIGYCEKPEKIPDPTKAILSASTNSISFLTDILSSGNIDTITYILGPKSELASSSNPNDRFLYRVVNSTPLKSSMLGIVTEFELIFFNSLRDSISSPVAIPGEIESMQLSIKVENQEAYASEYSDAYWRQVRLASRNLRSR